MPKNPKKIEIERKFLVKNNLWRKDARGIIFWQGYLSTDSLRTVRIRLEGKVGKITIKGKKRGITGDEFEYDIPANDAKYLLKKLCIQPTIKKKRYKVPHGSLVWDVDVFQGMNKGLVIAEIELKKANQKIELPNWIGKEVTNDKRFRNANLVTNPYFKWKKDLVL
ncbi:MAG: CYTH domain-containing protein [Ignavibacteriaceae bacterium]|nr:CYTH domain-containing protein [Ignavibacteriaceae bacterium]